MLNENATLFSSTTEIAICKYCSTSQFVQVMMMCTWSVAINLNIGAHVDNVLSFTGEHIPNRDDFKWPYVFHDVELWRYQLCQR